MKTDILIMGSGLAGMCAAHAAKTADSDLHVTVLSPVSGPQGSSFRNIHNRLGIQVLQTEKEKEKFIRDALSIAPPGEIDQRLARILAHESGPAFNWLKDQGADLEKSPEGDLHRVAGCFSPDQKTAALIKDVDLLFQILKTNLKNLGVVFLSGWYGTGILMREKVTGVFIEQTETQNKEEIKVGAVILACGGRTFAFKNTIAGTGKESTLLHDWCQKNNVQYVNKDYTQFVWCRAEDFGNWNIKDLADKGAGFKDKKGNLARIPDSLMHLFQMRQTHAPISNSLTDRAIDEILIHQLDNEGCIDVFHPGKGWVRIVMAAQASNGGIRIDEYGKTSIRGLFACGECTGGMHGADRIGGAMVLSALVFGKRAGEKAAEQIKN